MPWFRVDDALAFHAKTVAVGNAAMGMWVRAGSWSLQQLTDGFIPTHIVLTIGTRGGATALVASGMWEEADGGYLFHDWDEYQPTADEIRAGRAATHEVKVKAGRIGGVASGVARRKHSGSKSEPDMKQPGSSDEAEGQAKRKQNEAPTPTPTPTHPLKEPDDSQVRHLARTADVSGLVGEWIEHCKQRPPERVVGQVAKELRTLADEGFTPAQLRTGLADWHSKGQHPSTVASFVNAAVNSTSRPQTTTNGRVQRALDLAAQYAEEESRRQPAIGQ